MSRASEEAAAASYGRQAINAIHRSMRGDVLVMAGWQYHEEQAVRLTRLALAHAYKARPSLRPRDSYDRSVAAYKTSSRR
jgi:hypothetical protein